MLVGEDRSEIHRQGGRADYLSRLGGLDDLRGDFEVRGGILVSDE